MGDRTENRSEENGLSRRGFMRMAGLGTAGAAVAVAAGTPDAAEAASASGPRRPGYAETDHIKTYYALARM